MSAPTIVFDLDGTLVDTAPDLIDTLNVIFAREGLSAIPFVKARPMIGGGVKPLIERGLQADGRTLPAGELDRVYRDYLAHYADHIADRSRPFPGAADALDECAARGARLAVCTNKLEWLSVRLLDALGLSGRFAAICGQDTFGVMKPDPQVLRRTIEKAGGAPELAVMVGDSATDIDTAKAAGIPVVAVTFGYSQTPVRQFGPDRSIGHYRRLTATVFELLEVAKRSGLARRG